MIFKRLIIVLIGFYLSSLYTQEKSKNLVYDGDILFRSFYLSRDILLEKQTKEVCPNPIENYLNPTNIPNTKCKEKRDEHRIRFRLNFLFSPSSNVDVYYGLEVGDVSFGRERNLVGPGSGGSGSGATNVETRELRLSMINKNYLFRIDVGIFPYSTPDGLVLAASGAGVRLRKEFKEINSQLEIVYFKLQDNSFKDSDFNGFSDENYKDVELISTIYKIFRFSTLTPQFYFVYKRDPIEKDKYDNPKDTFQFYWIGTYQQYTQKNWNIYLNIVNQQGYLFSETKIIPNEAYLKTYFSDVYQFLQNQNNAFPRNRKKYPKNAYAGNIEFSYRILNELKISYVLTTATGRMGLNHDGTITFYNKDYYESANGAFQFSEIGIDSSGGYSIINIDTLSGMIAQGIKFEYQFLQGVLVEPQYYLYKTHKTPVIDYNQFFNRMNFKNPSNYYGSEWNVKIVYKPWVNFSIRIQLAYFNAGDAYKVINDIKNGDSLREYSFYIQQKF